MNHAIEFLIMAVVGGAIGTFAVIALAFFQMADHIARAIRARLLALQDVEISVNVRIEAEDFEGTSSVKWSGAEITALAVDKWLEQRGLIAQPRGVDWRVKQRPGATEGQA